MILVVKPAARSDILRQIGYYGDLGRADVGIRFFDAVRFSLDRLVQTPLAGSPKHFDHPELDGMRAWPVKGFDAFRLYYLVQDDRLVVVRVLHGRRDVEGVLEDFEDDDH